MRRRFLFFALMSAMLAGPWCLGTALAAAQDDLRVAAAADLKFALDEVVDLFRVRHPNIRLQVTYGSSGNFYAQLSNHAPFDVFLSADLDYPQRLVREGLASDGDEFVYGVGRIVVWVPQSSPIDVEKLGMKSLLSPDVRKIAIANPRHAPYGRAAEAAMKSMGVYEQVKDRLVLGDSVLQAGQFVESGNADIGIISRSHALAPSLRDKGRFWEVPLDAYPRRVQGGVILSWTKSRSAADAFRNFVLGEEARTILRRFGFEAPGD